jgi:hypothetical protein
MSFDSETMSIITAATKIVVSADQVSCDLSGEAAMLHLKTGVYYGLNPVGARIWSLIQEPKSFAELRDALTDEYDVDATVLESDLQKLLSELAEHDLIEIS